MASLPPGSMDGGQLGEQGLPSRPEQMPSGKLQASGKRSEDFTEELRARLAAIERKIDALAGLREEAPVPQTGHLAEALRGMEAPLQPSLAGAGDCRAGGGTAVGGEEANAKRQADGGQAPILMADVAAAVVVAAGDATQEQSKAAERGVEQDDPPPSRGRTAWLESTGTRASLASDFERMDRPNDSKSVERERSRVMWSTSNESLPQANHFLKRLGLEKTRDSLRKALENPSAMKGWQFIHSPCFNFICSVMIVLNAFFIGYSINVMLWSEMRDEPNPSGLIVVEILFAVFFVVELVLRACAERWLFFVGPEFKWNMFDLLLVLMSIVDLLLFMSGSDLKTNLTLGRVFRVARFFRLARLSRVIRQFSALRLVLFAVLDSMTSLFWCFVVIGLAIYIFAVLFLSATTDHFQAVGGAAQDDVSEELRLWYGGLFRTTTTLFMVISGGVDWVDVMRPLASVDSIYVPIFMFYVFVMHFGVLNVVVGTFVATATDIAARDREALVKSELRQWQVYTERIKTFFQEADLDKSGTLSWEEFRTHLDNQDVKAYFQSLDLDVSQAHVLFELLDADGSNMVTIDEFLDGCMRLKGQAKSIDLNMLLYMSKKVYDRMTLFMRWSEHKCSLVEERLGIPPGDP